MLSSPVIELLLNLLKFDKASTKAVYLQLAEQITSAIQKAILAPGSCLPGTRQLAEHLRLHRKTVVAAYEELVDQGLITMIPNKGSYINRDIATKLPSVHTIDSCRILLGTTSIAVPNNRILDLEKIPENGNWILDDGKMDIRLFLEENWHVTFSNKSYRSAFSINFLKHQLAQYIMETQHLSVVSEQIMVTSNAAMSLALVTQAVLSAGDIVVVGAPGNYKLNMAIQQTGAHLKSIPTESDGLDVLALEDLCKKQTIKMVCVNPQHHYPTTVILSYAKRLELLRLAYQYGFLLLEEEVQGLCDFQKRKISSLLTLDTKGIVAHIHSFEQMVRPDWNVSYVVAPAVILQEASKYKSYLGIDNFGLAQNILSNALQAGTLQRTIKKTTKTYLQRRNTFCQLMSSHWGRYAQYEVPRNGLGLWIHFEWDFNLAAFAKKCVTQGLVIPSHLLYQSRKWNGVRIGFGRWEEDEMEQIIQIGKKALE